MTISAIEDIIQDIRQGKMVIMIDDEDRENEGDIVMAAQKVTPLHITFMARQACGLICLAMSFENCEKIGLKKIIGTNHSRVAPNFTLSIEAAEGITTGMSSSERAHTILTAIQPDATPESVVQPGHVFPLVAEPGGVLARAGHTEAGVELARLAGLVPAAVICEVLNEDGSMARLPSLKIFAKKHALKLGTIADLRQYCLNQNKISLEMVSEINE